MPLHPAYAQVSALLGAVFILIAGNGLLSTFVPLSAVAAGFSDFTIGLIASSYFLGMLIGCIATPRLVARAGHIRAFAAMAAIAAVSALAHPILPEPLAWAIIRGITGFCFAGLFATIESWFHDKADNAVRGQVLALYQMFNFAGSAFGQQLVRFAPPGAFALFSAAAALLSLAVLPLAFTKSDPPQPPPVPRLRLWFLYRLSPVALLGGFVAGATNGTLWSLGPLFATSAGLTPGGVATFMSAIILAAAMIQWPTGRYADRYDRRFVMLATLVAACIVEIALAMLASAGSLTLYLLAMALGATALVIYPLASGHAADLSKRENMIEISTGLLLVYTVGAIIGPTVCAALMTWIGPQALFIHNAVIHFAFILFIAWRLWARPPAMEAEKPPEGEAEPFVRPIRK